MPNNHHTPDPYTRIIELIRARAAQPQNSRPHFGLRFQRYLDDMEARQAAYDDIAIEQMRTKFGDAEAAKLASELYKHRRMARGDVFGIFPRWLVLISAILLAVLETAETLPRVFLAVPRVKAEYAEYETKEIQRALVSAQAYTEENNGLARGVGMGAERERMMKLFDDLDPNHPYTVRYGKRPSSSPAHEEESQ